MLLGKIHIDLPMTEFYKKNEEENKKADEWLNQFKPNFESTIAKIGKYQERKLLSLQVIASAFKKIKQ